MMITSTDDDTDEDVDEEDADEEDKGSAEDVTVLGDGALDWDLDNDDESVVVTLVALRYELLERE